MKITDKALNIYKKTAVLEAYVRAGWEVTISLKRERSEDENEVADFIVAYRLNVKMPARLYPWVKHEPVICGIDMDSYEAAANLALKTIRSTLSEVQKIISEIKSETKEINNTFDSQIKIENVEED
ncbi:hypothetical protein [Loigolactobacillus rennini]|uniref:Uncharacterized protein n=1 Tax=Loigolactobacillus rennini DSM 20253 TaxID=1423796 RepID=A0A0R2CSS0_9LACO|nr:hypothetical protein [Loigolactobacillus rennini]KRM94831.1 hypothetical protein FC24_GL000122 [Loigolactobacillus rennini DSM 20253]